MNDEDSGKEKLLLKKLPLRDIQIHPSFHQINEFFADYIDGRD